MRAQEILEVAIANEIPEDLTDKYLPEPQGRTYLINIPDLKVRIEALTSIPGMGAWRSAFADTQIMTSKFPEKTIPYDDRAALWRLINKFRIEVDGIIKLVRDQVSTQTEECVYIKLPTSDSLSRIASLLQQLEKLIGQLVFHPRINGVVQLRSWEKGSLWIELFLGGAAAVGLVGSAAWASAVIRRKILEGNAVAEHIRSLKIANDAKEAVQKGHSELIDATVEMEVANIYDAYFEGDDSPETRQRISHVIREFADLIGQGCEIHPALLAPENVKNLFPSIDTLMTLESKVPTLKEHKESEK
jgi:hypothetical protein